jgi:chromosome segregation ATPase
MPAAPSAALQAQNAALQQKVAHLKSQLREAETKIDQCTRTIEAAKSSVQLHEQSVLLSQIIEEESNQAEISNLEARVQQLTRELALKDAIISKQSCSVPSYDQAALNAEAALKAEVASLQKECASLAKQNHEAASAYKALQTEVASLQRASSTAQNASAAVVELMSLLADFEKKVPKLSSTIARLELDLQSEKQQRVRAEQSLETALSRESSSNEALQHTEERLQQATASLLKLSASSRVLQPRCHLAANGAAAELRLDCDVGWSAAVQRHAVALVVSSVVERVVARAGVRALLQRHRSAESVSRPNSLAITHDAATQCGCSAGEVSSLVSLIAADLSTCLHPISSVAGPPLAQSVCLSSVEAIARTLLTNDCSTLPLAAVAGWCSEAAERVMKIELRAKAAEAERDTLTYFREQLQQENTKFIALYQKQQQRLAEMERAMFASVNDVQQLSQQMGSLLAIIKDKDADNISLAKQTSRLKQHLAIQNDLQQQIEGQKQRILQYQVLERESLQLKVRHAPCFCFCVLVCPSLPPTTGTCSSRGTTL